VTAGPQIWDQEMDQSACVVDGRDTSILIPGVRLWRSATVTLGSQRADRIWVLPNMEGLIALFQPVRLSLIDSRSRPRAVVESGADGMNALGGLELRRVKLRVWTSEGVAVALNDVCVAYDPSALRPQEPKRMPPQADVGQPPPVATDGPAEPDREMSVPQP